MANLSLLHQFRNFIQQNPHPVHVMRKDFEHEGEKGLLVQSFTDEGSNFYYFIPHDEIDAFLFADNRTGIVDNSMDCDFDVFSKLEYDDYHEVTWESIMESVDDLEIQQIASEFYTLDLLSKKQHVSRKLIIMNDPQTAEDYDFLLQKNGNKKPSMYDGIPAPSMGDDVALHDLYEGEQRDHDEPMVEDFGDNYPLFI